MLLCCIRKLAYTDPITMIYVLSIIYSHFKLCVQWTKLNTRTILAPYNANLMGLVLLISLFILVCLPYSWT